MSCDKQIFLELNENCVARLIAINCGLDYQLCFWMRWWDVGADVKGQTEEATVSCKRGEVKLKQLRNSIFLIKRYILQMIQMKTHNCACLVDNKCPAKMITGKTSDAVGLFFLLLLFVQILFRLGGEKKKKLKKNNLETREATKIDSHLRVTTGALACSAAADRGQLPLSRLP